MSNITKQDTKRQFHNGPNFLVLCDVSGLTFTLIVNEISLKMPFPYKRIPSLNNGSTSPDINKNILFSCMSD